MESSKEKIESQLCAYVEGELDDAERAEIERHLQTNPQHKTLIAELRQQRHLLQTLPKANIPGELNESLTGQLERSALLNEDDQTSEAGMRINRWPQLAAVAAVLFLAVGLGVVVYYVLPGHGGGHNGTVGGAIAMNDGTAAAKRAPALPASGPATAEAELETLKRDRDAKLEEKSAQDLKVIAGRPEAAATATAPVADARARGFGYESLADRAAAPLRELTTGPGLVTPGEVVQLQQWMNRTIGGAANDAFHLAPQNSLYLVVQTSDPATANGQVVAYFKSNNIQYMSQPERLAADKDLNYAFRSNDAAPKPGSQAGEGGGRGAGGGSGGAFGGGIANGTTAAAPSSLAGGASALAPAQTPNAAKPIDQARGVASPPASDAETLSLGASDKAAKSDPAKAAVEVGQASELSKGVAGAAAGNQPADRFKEQDSAGEGRVALRARGETALRRATLPQAAGELAAEAPRPAAGDVIVARMNRRQANELSAALSREQGQRAELREFGDIDATIATGVKATLADNSAASAKLGTVVAQDRGREAGATAAAPSASKPAEQTPAPPESFTRRLATEHSANLQIEGARGPAAPAQPAKPAAQTPAEGTPLSRSAGEAGDKPTPAAVASGLDALRLTPDPLDEPVDVVILVKTPLAPPQPNTATGGPAATLQAPPEPAGGDAKRESESKK